MINSELRHYFAFPIHHHLPPLHTQLLILMRKLNLISNMVPVNIKDDADFSTRKSLCYLFSSLDSHMMATKNYSSIKVYQKTSSGHERSQPLSKCFLAVLAVRR